MITIEVTFKTVTQRGIDWADETLNKRVAYFESDSELKNFLNSLADQLADNIWEVRWNYEGLLQGYYIPGPARMLLLAAENNNGDSENVSIK